MHEFDSLSVSTYEASSLAAKLTEKSSEGWDVVAIVPTGSDVTAYLKRSATDSDSAPAPADASTAETPDAAGTGTWGTATESGPAAAAAEPAGWGTAPESAPPAGSSWGSGGATSGTDTTGSWGSGAATGGWGTSTPAATPSAPAAPSSSAPSTPAVPPGWYADPAGRYELRYWDGSAWTEHVSRAGQQYTDPPVA